MVSEQEGVIRFQGNGISGTYRNGKFDTRQAAYGGASFDVDAVKTSFGKAVVKKAAKQYGWKVKAIGNNKYEVTKG